MQYFLYEDYFDNAMVSYLGKQIRNIIYSFKFYNFKLYYSKKMFDRSMHDVH